MKPSLIITSFVLLLGTSILNPSVAQEISTEGTSASDGDNLNKMSPTVQAIKLSDSSHIVLDGYLDEAIWKQASVATDFIQRSPDDGEPASERTEAHIVYTAEAIYVGIKAFDSAMDSVAATLFRKDGSAYSDWVYVNIDSYNDKRTSFSFAVNPRGVRKDILTFDNDNEDIRWDAVWEAKTSIQSEGWTVEMRIPLSQLRFSVSDAGQTWGINFQRRIARKEEVSFWSPTPQDVSGFVSSYGTLEGLQDLQKPGRLEVIPYASTNLKRTPEEPGNPFYDANNFNGSVGGDLKYGITSDLTLTATINPDFGQVEADPAVINLSAFETFFPEQRPFFLEGKEIFEFGSTKTYNSYGNPITFYSRRIGRAPSGNLNRYNRYRNQEIFNPDNAGNQFTDMPEQTTIAAAAKVSGKTRNGWSIGLLDAYTVKETSPFFVRSENGLQQWEGNFPVEPTSNYLVARTKKDINEGNTIFGAFVSATNRSINDRYFEQFLHKSAYLGGLDFEHNWNDRNWALSGTFSASSVTGTQEAILQTQQSPARYFNRVDSDRLSVDPTKRSLSGYAGEFSFSKSGGEHWRASATYSTVSPGYEVNDLGFQNRADYRAVSTSLIYQEPSPKNFRYFEVWSFDTWAWNFDGNLISNFYNAGGYVQFNNLWSFNLNFNYGGQPYLDRMTRGGPLARRVRDWNVNFNLNSDRTKKVSFNVGSLYRKEFPKEGVAREYDHYFWSGIRVRPATNIQLEIEPEIGFEKDTDQFVTIVEDPTAVNTYGARYVFADITRTNFSTEIRLDWTFTTDISLQLYARPFITTGNFENYKEFATPRRYRFDIYGEDAGTINSENGTYTIDPDGNGPADSFSFQEQDFNFRSIQGNAVFRWEYRPGATLFLVWQHDRSSFDRENDFYPGRDFNRLFNADPTNVFLIKISYWIGS